MRRHDAGQRELVGVASDPTDRFPHQTSAFDAGFFLRKCPALIVGAGALAARSSGEPFDCILMDMRCLRLQARQPAGADRNHSKTIPALHGLGRRIVVVPAWGSAFAIGTTAVRAAFGITRAAARRWGG